MERLAKVPAVVFLILFTLSPHSEAGMAAFPGAEGFGAIAVGGRGGRIIKVINSNSSGPGSLQEACEMEGPRIVVFDVAGVIKGDVSIRHPHITIAGQTAPSPGITVVGRLLARPAKEVRLHDIVVRFIRFRPPPTQGHTGDAVQLPKTERVILDHLSLSWANDEIIDICHSSEVTVQWCTVEESDTEGHDKGIAHNYGLISAYPGSGNVSIHHNIFAHQSRRSPSISPAAEAKPGDFRNNIIYNFRDGLTHDGHVPKGPINLIANYYKKGPNAEIIYLFEFNKSGRYYVKGNYIEGVGEIADPRDENQRLPFWVRIKGTGEKLGKPAKVAPVNTQTALESYKLVMQQAGCFPRDRVTRRTIEEVIRGAGEWGRNAPANPTGDWYFEGLKFGKTLIDSDGDGITDAWESCHGLNKEDAGDYNTVMPSGYTAIEEYINERADLLIRKAIRANY